MKTCGCVLPVIKNKSAFSQLKTPIIKGTELYNIDKMAFFCAYEEDCTVKFFLDALTRYEFEDAKAYISKNYVSKFDLDELSNYFCGKNNYMLLAKVEFKKPPKNCITNSIMVVESRSGNETSIIHLHMIKEPDVFGKWKIYGIDKE